MCLHLYVDMYTLSVDIQSPEEGVGDSGLTGSYELPDVCVGYFELWSSTRAVCTLNC